MLQKFKLDNGVRVVCEKIPHVRSLSIGIWVGAGSRSEEARNNGISHFIEHMFFKGTETRTAREIAESFDSIGGQLNAFTGKECTCYYAKVLDTYLERAVDVLADMFFNSKLSAEDVEIERKVILEEIGMYEDTPEDLVHDLLSGGVWDGNPLGYSILGTKESLKGIDRAMIQEYMRENYTPVNTVISVAGNFKESELTRLLEKYFGGWESKANRTLECQEAEFQKKVLYKKKDTEQLHVCIGFNGVEHGDDRLYSLLAVNNVLGGGMSSRLFQKIREEKGLVYSIYSYPSSYKKAGLFTVYAAMSPGQLKTVTKLIAEEINKLQDEGLSDAELAKSKEQLKGGYILGLESTGSRMHSLGKSELLLGEIFTPDEVLAKIDAVTEESVKEVIESVFVLDRMSTAVVGNIKKEKDLEKLLG